MKKQDEIIRNAGEIVDTKFELTENGVEVKINYYDRK